MKNKSIVGFGLVLFTGLTGCDAESITASLDAAGIESDGSGTDSNKNDSSEGSQKSNGRKKLVCDPFVAQGGGAQPQIRGLLYGDIPNAHHSTHFLFEHYFEVNELGYEKYLLGDVVLRLSSVNILPRDFETGFPVSGTGSNPELLRSESTGEVLNEYFGLKLDTILKLTENDAEGDYEFAIISDDGASMKFDEDAADWIREESIHPPVMTCAAQMKNLTRESRKRLKLQYFQGPKTIISFALLMRPAGGAPEYFCHRDPVTGLPPAMVPMMGDTLHSYFTDNGWKMVEPGNFELPQEFASEGSCE
jgi:hypothetical protein